MAALVLQAALPTASGRSTPQACSTSGRPGCTCSAGSAPAARLPRCRRRRWAARNTAAAARQTSGARRRPALCAGPAAAPDASSAGGPASPPGLHNHLGLGTAHRCSAQSCRPLHQLQGDPCTQWAPGRQLALAHRHTAGLAFAGPGAPVADKWWKRAGAPNLHTMDSLADFLNQLVRPPLGAAAAQPGARCRL